MVKWSALLFISMLDISTSYEQEVEPPGALTFSAGSHEVAMNRVFRGFHR
jgi:hypothetical protein